MRSGDKEMGQKIKRGRQLNLKRELRVGVLGGGGGKRLGLGVCFPSIMVAPMWIQTGLWRDLCPQENPVSSPFHFCIGLGSLSRRKMNSPPSGNRTTKYKWCTPFQKFLPLSQHHHSCYEAPLTCMLPSHLFFHFLACFPPCPHLFLFFVFPVCVFKTFLMF